MPHLASTPGWFVMPASVSVDAKITRFVTRSEEGEHLRTRRRVPVATARSQHRRAQVGEPRWMKSRSGSENSLGARKLTPSTPRTDPSQTRGIAAQACEGVAELATTAGIERRRGAGRREPRRPPCPVPPRSGADRGRWSGSEGGDGRRRVADCHRGNEHVIRVEERHHATLGMKPGHALTGRRCRRSPTVRARWSAHERPTQSA